jgi:hypothetical protein
MNRLRPPTLVPLGCWIDMELPVIAWVVVVVEKSSVLYPKGSDDEGLGVTGVPIAAWLTTALPTGIVGM